MERVRALIVMCEMAVATGIVNYSSDVIWVSVFLLGGGTVTVLAAAVIRSANTVWL
jgi:hypothetical protein